MIEQGDDLYLLRLVVQTGPVTKYQDRSTARAVLSKLNKFVRSARFEVLEIDWIEESCESGLFADMTEDEQNEYLDTLYQLSRNSHNQSLSMKATQVYSTLRKAMAARIALTNMVAHP
mmetsp:Transcript_7511/g.9080  ORF Transcript_7511/g.9080 Transcript_7511/m.9080 type:complete len:118 (-) Transcript_7511:65-418(-)